MTPAGRVVTGCNVVFVKTTREKPEDVVEVWEGHALPADVADGEVERLEALGAFDEHPRERQARVLKAAEAEALAAGQTAVVVDEHGPVSSTAQAEGEQAPVKESRRGRKARDDADTVGGFDGEPPTGE